MRVNPKKRLVALGTALIAGFALAGPFAWNSTDGWSADELAQLASLRLSELPAVRSDPSNAYETSPAAIGLGQRIFADQRFSSNGAVSCASCRQAESQFQDGLGKRHTMPVVAAGYSPYLFWDGRKDSLWPQALGPLEDPAEHGGNRLAYARVVEAHYRTEYEAIFGPLPKLRGLPKNAGPFGTPAEKAAWNAMGENARNEVSRVFANVGKTLAAYQKILRHEDSRLDRYFDAVVRHDAAASGMLSKQEKNGLRLFIGKAQCVTCHNGPLMTDQAFHKTGIAPRAAGMVDPGRSAAIAKLLQDEFNYLGTFSDARPEQCEELRFLATDDHTMQGAFKTPSLRKVALRPPYMYAGQVASLTEVVHHYNRAPQAATWHSELKPLQLSENEVRELVAFLGALNGKQVCG
jgi:cytochrome c peroxidase